MQIESLRLFRDVAKFSSVSRAAKENGISQPAASQSVHQLEERLGVKLIDRSKRPLVLTRQGRVFYDGCREIVARYDALEDRVKSLEDDRKLAGTVRVVSIYSVGLNHMKEFVQRFHESYPGAHARLEYLHPTQVLESIVEGEADLGLISYPKNRPDLVVIPWKNEEMILAVPPSHPFATLREIETVRIDGAKLVGFEKDLSIRRAIDAFLRRGGVHVEVAMVFDNIENIKRAVEAEEGVAILPAPSMAAEMRSGSLVGIPFKDHEFARPLAIIHRREPLDPSASRFLAMLTADSKSSAPQRCQSAVSTNPPESDSSLTNGRPAAVEAGA